jgi:tight adherence protein B
MNFTILIIAGCALIGAVLLIVAVLLSRKERAQVGERLAHVVGYEAPAQTRADLRARVNEAVDKTERGSRVGRDLARADLKLTAGEFFLLKFGSAVVMALAGAVLSSLAMGRWVVLGAVASALVGGVVGSFFPDFYVKLRIRRRVSKFNNGLADIIAMLASSLRSGYSLLQAIDLVAREGSGPISSEFRRVVQEVGLGLSTEAALANLLRRVPSDDLDLMITAINIQHEVGGNLSQILDSIATTIRERVRIKGEIRTLTAQGRISGYVITALPVALAIFLVTTNPGYMEPIFTFGFPPEAWCCLPVTSSFMIVIGYFAIMKIVNIDI